MKTVQILTSHIGIAIFIAIIYITWLLRRFSQRIGEVTRMPSTYHWFNVGNGLVFIALLSYMFQCSAALAFEEPGSVWILRPFFSLFTFYIPLTLGLGIDVTVAYIYWGWLIRER